MRIRVTAVGLAVGALMMLGPGVARASEPQPSLTCLRLPPIQLGLCR